MFDSISFAYPWIPFIFPVFLFLPYLRRSRVPAAFPTALARIEMSGKSFRSTLGSFLLPTLNAVFLFLLFLAAARPQHVTTVALGEEQRRNIMLALDASKSMDARDFLGPQGVVQRMEGVKTVTRTFIRERAGDRIGLVIFGTNAFLQAPLTVDHNLLGDLVDQLRVGVAGDGTAIGDGLGVSLKRIEELPADTRAIILLTDGVSNSGRVEPLKAAKIAKELGVRVYTIGIGSKEGGFVELGGGIFRPRRIRAEFDEETLKEIASITGGKYYFASNASELDEVYRQIDQLEKTNEDEYRFVQTQELAEPLLAAALCCFLLHYFLSQTLFRVLP